MKVYCKNCKWYDGFGCVVGSYQNPYFTEKYINHKGYKASKWKNKEEFEKECKKHGFESDISNYTKISCCNFNKNYDCKYYKQVWWKFWRIK